MPALWQIWMALQGAPASYIEKVTPPSSQSLSPRRDVMSSNDHPRLLWESCLSGVGAGGLRDMLPENLEQGSNKQSHFQRQLAPMSARLNQILLERPEERMCR